MARAVSMAVMQPTECSTAERRMRKPSVSCLRPLVGVNVGVGLRDAVDPLALDARLLEHVAGAGGGKELDAHLLKAPGDAHDLLFVLVLDSDDDTAATLGRLQTGPLEGLQQGLREGLGPAPRRWTSSPGPGRCPRQ